MTDADLIGHASAVLRSHLGSGQRPFGHVAAALISESGEVYTGVCIDTASCGLCAKRNARFAPSRARLAVRAA